MANIIEVAAINVAIAAEKLHFKEAYIAIFESAFESKIESNVRGDDFGYVGSFHPGDSSDEYNGEFFKYLKLDKSRRWHNRGTKRQANAEDMKRIRIPDELLPHFAFFPFILFPKEHLVVYICKDGDMSLSPRLATRLLAGIFDTPKIKTEFGPVSATAVPEHDILKRIWRMKQMRVLEITVTPPNADDLRQSEKALYEALNIQHVDTLVTTLKSGHHKGIEPNPDTKTLAEIAKLNGKVVARGVYESSGLVEQVSTVEHPSIDRVQFDGNLETAGSALRRTAIEWVKRLTRGKSN